MSTTAHRKFIVDEGEEGAFRASPRSVVYGCHQDNRLDTLCERALSIAQSALVYSDVNFLFQPGQIAFAAVALALDGHGYGVKLGTSMRDYICMRFRNKTLQELSEFEEQVGRIISHLESCSSIDLSKFSPNLRFRRDPEVVENQASEIRRVLCIASRLRVMANASFQVACPPHPPPVSPMHHIGFYHHAPHQNHHVFHPLSAEGTNRKRIRDDDDTWTPQLHHQFHRHCRHLPHPHYYKVARVTPIMMER
jgi:hypothetical protein